MTVLQSIRRFFWIIKLDSLTNEELHQYIRDVEKARLALFQEVVWARSQLNYREQESMVDDSENVRWLKEARRDPL